MTDLEIKIKAIVAKTLDADESEITNDVILLKILERIPLTLSK